MVRFVISEHSMIEKQVIEIWEGDKFIGQITPADTTGVRVMTKYAMKPEIINLSGNIEVVCCQMLIDTNKLL